MLWIRFITKLLKITKSWLVVLDAWFKWWYIEKWIFTVCKRHFLVRIWLDQSYYDDKLNEFKIKDFLKVENSISVNWINLRVIKNVMLKSWFKKWIKLETNLIIYHKKWFYKPAILCTSADIWDIYENMFREIWDLSWKEKLKQLFSNNALLKVKSENEIYFSFVLLYQKRWSIEVCFRELKTYLWFEKFQVQDYNAIMKYLHICILIHSLLYITLSYIYLDISLKSFIYDVLKKKRNIKNDYFDISFDGLKLFLEMSVFDTIFSFKKLSFSISLNSCLAFTNQIKLD